MIAVVECPYFQHQNLIEFDKNRSYCYCKDCHLSMYAMQNIVKCEDCQIKSESNCKICEGK